MDFDEDSRAFSAYQTILEMLEDRGYYVFKEVKELSKEAFMQKYQIEEGIVIVASKRYTEDSIIVNFFDEKKAISHKQLEKISLKMKESKILDGIIVSNAPLGAAADKVEPH